MGYLIAPEYLMKEIKKVHQFLVFSVNSVAQKTLADYLNVAQVATLGDFYKEQLTKEKVNQIIADCRDNKITLHDK